MGGIGKHDVKDSEFFFKSKKVCHVVGNWTTVMLSCSLYIYLYRPSFTIKQFRTGIFFLICIL